MFEDEREYDFFNFARLIVFLSSYICYFMFVCMFMYTFLYFYLGVYFYKPYADPPLMDFLMGEHVLRQVVTDQVKKLRTPSHLVAGVVDYVSSLFCIQSSILLFFCIAW